MIGGGLVRDPHGRLRIPHASRSARKRKTLLEQRFLPRHHHCLSRGPSAAMIAGTYSNQWRTTMRKNIRLALAAALGALALSTTAASAATLPADGADRNADGQVSWTEFVRHNSRFALLDENEDVVITVTDRFMLEGREESSWMYVEYLDTNISGAVTEAEYNRYLRETFAAQDRNGDGAISAREANRAGLARVDGDRRDGRRDLAARAAARFSRR